MKKLNARFLSSVEEVYNTFYFVYGKDIQMEVEPRVESLFWLSTETEEQFKELLFGYAEIKLELKNKKGATK